MATVTKILVLDASANTVLAPPIHFSQWNAGSLQKRFTMIPQPRIAECPPLSAEASQVVPQPPNSRTIYYQWVSPPLDGNQTFTVTTDSAACELVGSSPTLPAHSGSGVFAGVTVLRVFEPSSSTYRGGSLILASQVTTVLPPAAALLLLNTGGFSNTVNALDGDVLVLEAGWVWNGAKSGDNDDHGPAVMKANALGKLTFSLDVTYKDDALSCATGIDIGDSLIGSGPANTLAPSCDNVMLGG